MTKKTYIRYMNEYNRLTERQAKCDKRLVRQNKRRANRIAELQTNLLKQIKKMKKRVKHNEIHGWHHYYDILTDLELSVTLGVCLKDHRHKHFYVTPFCIFR